MAPKYPSDATPVELEMLKKHPPLTERHEKILLETPWAEILLTFKRMGFSRPRDWLVMYRRVLKRGQPEHVMAAQREESKLKLELNALKMRYDQALTDLEEAELQLEFLKLLDDVSPAELAIPKVESSKGVEHECTVKIDFADWHLGEVIDPKTVNGWNKFNPEIAELSVASATERAIKLLNLQQHARPVKHAVIAYLGDHINGELHRSAATNSHHLGEQAVWAKSLIMGQLDRLVDACLGRADPIEMTVIFCLDNHGRLTEKLEYPRLKGTSLSYVIYHGLAERYSDVEGLRIVVPESDSYTLNIYGERYRHRHGMEIRYRDGVYGPLVPAYKMIDKWNRNDPADYEVFGHLHTYGTPARILACGSLCGFNARAKAMGFERQPPLQAFSVADSRFGLTNKQPIFVR